MQMASNQGLLTAMANGGGDWDKTLDLARKSGQVLPTDLFEIQKHHMALQSEAAALDKSQRDDMQSKLDAYHGLLDGVEDQPSLDAANLEAKRRGLFTFPMATTSFTPFQQYSDPQHLKAYSNSLIGHSKALEESGKEAENKLKVAQAAEAAAKTTETAQTVTEKERGQMVEAIQAAPQDQGMPTPATWQSILTMPATDDKGNPTTYQKKFGLPATPTPQYIANLVTSTVSTKDQPEYLLKLQQANALRTMQDADWQNYLDRVVPDRNSPLYQRTAALVQFYRAQGNLKGADDAVRAAGEQLGKTETAVATARATVPFKVEVAGASAAARADQAGLTDDDYRNAGEIYGRTGVMPALGRDSVTRGRIEHYKNQWAKDNGFSPADLVTMQAAYKGDIESLKKFQTQRDQIASFEQTAQKNLDLMLAAGQKLIDTHSPWLNKPLRDISRSALGSDAQAAFDAAQLIAQNEVAKVTSGGGLGGVVSDTAKREMQEAMGKNPTIGNMVAVAKVLKQDMANRHQSMDATLSDIKARIGGQGGGGAGGQKYQRTATGSGGHKIGTNDNGATWYDVETGKRIQ
jgi:hypothetical protein